jgi:hypothetical protein
MSVAAASAAPAEGAGRELVDPHELAFPESVALAVVLQVLRDLQGGSMHHRHDARCCVRSGALNAWIEQLALPDDAARRVAALLEAMACAALQRG